MIKCENVRGNGEGFAVSVGKKSCIYNFQKMASSDDAFRIAMTTLLDNFHEVHYNVCQFLCGVIIVHILNKVM